MIRTYKVKHNIEKGKILDLLHKSQQVASYVVKESKKYNKRAKLTSKDVKQFCLHSHISGSIIKKYANNKKLKALKLSKVKVSFFLINKFFNEKTKILNLQPIKTKIKIWFPTENIIKWNYVELDKEYAHIVVTLKDAEKLETINSIGIDLNATSHSIVVASPKSGKFLKLGREIPHLKKKYRNIRTRLQKQGKKKQLCKLSKKERRKTVDIINKSVNRIVKFAIKENAFIKMEDLEGIRTRCSRKYHSELNHTINSWPFFMVRTKLTHKALQYGIEINFIDPRFTSQKCSRCGHTSKQNRNGKKFKCEICSHFDHADVNAAFNIAATDIKMVDSLAAEKKVVKRIPMKRKKEIPSATSSMVNDIGLSVVPI
jgi:putative transposase